ncbi:hypothetical protein LMG28138_03556 [Pararobbsia alpina]|uniref:Uncharacterized protein n=1 Tax=Pararobbsia alpina TaxID=621374 RepID=A0A6S7BAD9_9BURK|nr:hypothetical protein LMG28138_03556 [Pararobbsia alpina]
MLVLVVGEWLRIEGHPDEVEVRIEAVYLQRILDVVGRRTIAIVVRIERRGAALVLRMHDAVPRWQWRRAQNIGTALRTRILLLCDQRVVERRRRHTVLPRSHVDLPDHAHLQMLGRRDVAVPEVGAGVRREVVVSEARTDIDRDRRIRHTVEEGRCVRIAVKVDRVLLEQVGTHDHPDVGERQEELVVLVERHRRCWHVAVHHTDVHDLPRIDVPGQLPGRRRFRIGHKSDRTVVGRIGTCIADGIEHRRELRTRQPLLDISQSGQGPEGKQVGLRAVAHRGIAVPTRDLLTLDRAVDDAGGLRVLSGDGRTCIGRFARTARQRLRMKRRGGWALHPERLPERGQRAQQEQQRCDAVTTPVNTEHMTSVQGAASANRAGGHALSSVKIGAFEIDPFLDSAEERRRMGWVNLLHLG